jgi:hypothetical protein
MRSVLEIMMRVADKSAAKNGAIFVSINTAKTVRNLMSQFATEIACCASRRMVISVKIARKFAA